MTSITDVAKHAGVSPTTVSKVINNYSDVSEKTRKKVAESISLLQYEPNVVARSLVKKRSWTIGILLKDIPTNPFVAELTFGMKCALEKSGYDLLYLSAGWDNPEYSVIRHCASRNLDGLVVFGVGREHKMLSEIIRAEIPTMFVDDDLIGRRAGYITADSRRGIQEAMNHLVELGHQKIAFVSGHMDYLAGRSRFEGYQQSLRLYNLPYYSNYIEICSFDIEGGYLAMQNLLKLPNSPTAVVCISDLMAIGVINAIQDAGLNVPADISVTGFDNTAFSNVVKPKLTTVNQDVHALGEKSINQLLELIDNPDCQPPALLEPIELIIRQSTAAVKPSPE